MMLGEEHLGFRDFIWFTHPLIATQRMKDLVTFWILSGVIGSAICSSVEDPSQYVDPRIGSLNGGHVFTGE